MPTRLEPRIVPKTANYTVNPLVDRCGTIFTNRGATGAVTFTLPSLSSGQYLGLYYDFLGIADQNIVVAAPVADTLVAFNDAAADSVSLATAGNKIGGLVRAIWDGAAWAAVNLSNNTLTVTT